MDLRPRKRSRTDESEASSNSTVQVPRKRPRTDKSEASSSSTVQIPEDVLQKLLSSFESVEHIQNTVNHLQQTVSRLETDNDTLKTELRALQDRDGPKFPQFARLPPEIRRMIWTSAFMVPRLHIIETVAERDRGEDGARCSRHKQPLLDVCTESRDVVKLLQTPFTWLVKKDPHREDSQQFINCSIDTIWLNGDLPVSISEEAANSVHSILGPPYTRGKQSRLHGLVLNYSDWALPSLTVEEQHSGMVPTICEFGSPRNVYILVGQTKVTCPSKVRLIEPRWEPMRGASTIRYIVAPDSLFTPNKFRGMKPTITWQALALRIERVLKQFKEASSMSEEKFLQVHGFELLLDDVDDFDPTEEWDVPKISFVEAVEDNSDWIEYDSHPMDGESDSEDGFF